MPVFMRAFTETESPEKLKVEVEKVFLCKYTAEMAVSSLCQALGSCFKA